MDSSNFGYLGQVVVSRSSIEYNNIVKDCRERGQALANEAFFVEGEDDGDDGHLLHLIPDVNKREEQYYAE
jgi:hypothetical protein